MDHTRPDPDHNPRGGLPYDPAETPGDAPGDLQPNDGFDPLDPHPTEAEEEAPNDVTPVLPGEDDEMPEDDDLVSPRPLSTVPQSTPV